MCDIELKKCDEEKKAMTSMTCVPWWWVLVAVMLLIALILVLNFYKGWIPMKRMTSMTESPKMELSATTAGPASL